MNAPSLENQLIDIYPVIYEPFWQKPLFYIPAISLVFTVVAIGGYYFWDYLTRKKVDPWDQALSELALLAPFIAQKEYHAFYVQLTALIKRYLSNLYHTDIGALTDNEMVDYIKKVDLKPDLRETIIQFFNKVQYIKFADQNAAQEMMNADLVLCQNFIAQTIPIKDAQASN